MQAESRPAPRSTPERLAYWYFRLNGFMTIENFLVHPESGSHPRTDVDILATRFAHRRENSEDPMTDVPRIANCQTFANIIIAEIKTGMCRLNGPWTKPDAENMERVLRAIGCAKDDAGHFRRSLLVQGWKMVKRHCNGSTIRLGRTDE